MRGGQFGKTVFGVFGQAQKHAPLVVFVLMPDHKSCLA
ncbi:hypothetical protein X747_30080 [Mesorhizobium sp. LNJC384A00]|nr:hypothetical protein X747_30080 [Mesorhizobium sp. LNJC384A00]